MRPGVLYVCAMLQRFLFTSLSVLMMAVPAAAQDAPAREDIIIVTETRSPQLLDDIAANLAKLDASEIERVRGEHISELLARAPGVYLHRGNGQEHLTAIRSPVLTGGAGAGSFLFLENGVPLRAKGFANVNGLFEAHAELAGAVEVVRGPGGVAHGSNAVHGVINVLTPEPPAVDELGTAISAGAFGRVRADAFAGGARGRQALWLGFTYLHEDGFRADSGLNQQKFSARHVYDHGRLKLTTTLAGHNLDQETAGFVQGPDAYLDPVLRRTNLNPEAFREARALRISSRIEIAGDSTVFVLTPYGRWNEMDFLLHFLPSRALEENGHWSLGLQSALHKAFAGDGQLTAGLDLERTEGFLIETQARASFGSFPEGVHYDFAVRERNISGYFLYKRPVAERLTLDAGLRLESTSYAYDNRTGAGVTGRFNRPADRSDAFFTLAAKAGALYRASENLSLFLAYKRGQRAPQTADLYRLQINQQVDEIAPETVDSVEAGLRGWLGPARVEAAVYYMDKRNFFFRNADGFNIAGGRTRHTGVEASLVWPLTETLTFSGSGAFGDHEYRFDDLVARSSEVIRTGNAVDTAPRWISNARLLWTPLPGLSAEAEWARVGGYFTDAANDNAYPGHDLFHLRLAYELNDRIELFAALRNLGNTFYAERADFAFGNERYFPGEERAVSGGVRARF